MERYQDRNSAAKQDFHLVGEKPWSTVPAEAPPTTAHLLNVDADALDRLLPYAMAPGGDADDILVWTPPYAGSPRSGLRWGYTVVLKDGKLSAFQRVVYAPARVTPLLENACGTFILARDYDASAW